MGLHPLAIQTIILQMIEFIHAGYKVIVSTHSPVLLEFVWVYNCLKSIPENKRVDALCEVFDLQIPMKSNFNFLNDVYDKDIKTYYPFKKYLFNLLKDKKISGSVFSEYFTW